MDRWLSLDRDAARRWARDLLGRTDWVILDTETTGLDGQAEAIQIAVLAPDGAPLTATFVRPRGRSPREVIPIHGITDAMVVDAPTFAEVRPRLIAQLAGRRIVAYNAAFDRRILHQTARRSETPPIPASWECAMEQYARFVGRWSSRRRGYVPVPLPRGVASPAARHQALDDCRATLQVIRRMALEESGGRG